MTATSHAMPEEVKLASLSEFPDIPLIEQKNRDIFSIKKNSVEDYTRIVSFFCEDTKINDTIWAYLVQPRRVNLSPVFIAKLRNCLVLPSGIVILEDGRILVDSIYPETPKSFLERGGLSVVELRMRRKFLDKDKNDPEIVEVDKATHCRDRGEAGYFHWVASVLPRLSIVLDFFDGDLGVLLIEASGGFRLEWAKLFSIENHVMPARGRAIVVRDLIFPSPAQVGNSHYTREPWLLRHFRSAVQSAVPDNARDGRGGRIYISRSDASVRRISNEVEFFAQLEKLGFRLVTLQGMTVVEQISLFADASAVVGAHGAGLANLVFCKEETRVVELMSRQRTWPGFRVISQACNLRYASYVANAFEASQTASLGQGNEDFFVDVGTSLRFVRACLGE